MNWFSFVLGALAGIALTMIIMLQALAYASAIVAKAVPGIMRELLNNRMFRMMAVGELIESGDIVEKQKDQ